MSRTLLLAALSAALLPVAAADDGPVVVREVVHREDGVYLVLAGAVSGLAVGSEGSFAEEVRLGERAYRRTLARFVVVEVGPDAARARIASRVEGWLPVPGALVVPGAPALVEGETRALPLAPFEVVLAGEGAPQRLVVAIDLVVPAARAAALEAEVARHLDRIRSATLAVLLGLESGALGRPDVRETTAEAIRTRVARLLPPDPADPTRPAVRAVAIREWRVAN